MCLKWNNSFIKYNLLTVDRNQYWIGEFDLSCKVIEYITYDFWLQLLTILTWVAQAQIQCYRLEVVVGDEARTEIETTTGAMVSSYIVNKGSNCYWNWTLDNISDWSKYLCEFGLYWYRTNNDSTRSPRCKEGDWHISSCQVESPSKWWLTNQILQDTV